MANTTCLSTNIDHGDLSLHIVESPLEVCDEGTRRHPRASHGGFDDTALVRKHKGAVLEACHRRQGSLK